MHDPAKIDKPLIRVIDDDDAMRNSWAFLIEGEGWDVKTYADAITFLSSNDYIRPGCLLLDVRMPHMSGLELQLKLREAGCDLPIIFISGHGDIDMAVNTLKAGAIDFLQKPVDDQRLLKTIENAVSHSAAASAKSPTSATVSSRSRSASAKSSAWLPRATPTKRLPANTAFRKRPSRSTEAPPTASLTCTTPLKSHVFSC